MRALRKAATSPRDSAPWLALLAGLAWALPKGTAEGWAITSGLVCVSAVILGMRSALQAGGRRGLFSPIWALAGAFAGWMLLSTIWAADPSRALFESLMVAGLLFVLAGGTTSGEKWLVWPVAGLALLEAVVGMVRLNLGGPAMLRVSGSFVSANHHAALLVCGFAVATAMALRAKGTGRIAGWMAAGFVLLSSAALSGSRAAVVAAVAVLAASILTAPRKTGRRVLLVCGLAVLALLSPSGIARRVADQLGGGEPMPFGRLELWNTSIRMFGAHPVLGVGMGGYGEVFDSVKPASLAKMSSDYAHSEPLQLVCETGVVGGVLCVLLLLAVFRGLPAGLRGLPATVSCLAGLAVFAAVDFPLHNPVLGIIAVLCLTILAGKPSGAKPGAVSPLVRYAFTGIGVAVCAWVVMESSADFMFARGARALSAGNTGLATARFCAAMGFQPWHAPAMQALAEMMPESGMANKWSSEAIRLRPYWVAPVGTAFRIAVAEGRMDDAEWLVGRAERISPYGLETLLMESRFKALKGDMAGARKLLDSANARWPGNLDVALERAWLLEKAGDLEGCRAILRRILAKYPRNEMVGLWLARLVK